MRYYYDCPIIAAYMAKSFGIRIVGQNLSQIDFDTQKHPEREFDYFDICRLASNKSNPFVYKFCLSSDSIILLEPQDGDFVEANDERCPDCGTYYNHIPDGHAKFYKHAKIIERNGKLFFMPKGDFKCQ